MLRPLVEDLHERRAKAKLGGGEERIARQHEQEKLTARERIDLLVDDGTFTELGIHAGIHYSVRGLEDKEAPADGVITGYGKVDGRLVAVCAYDFTVMAGSMGMTGELKVARLRDLALTKRIPFVWLLDSAGARIQEAVGSLFAGSGHLFREEVVASGVIPQVAALMGPCAAGTAYIPGLADFVPMVKGRGSMALAGPHLVRAAIGEDVTQEELGGSRVHCRKSGVGDLEVADDEECIARIKQYLSFFPSALRGAPAGPRDATTPSTGWTTSCSTSCPTPTASRTTCTTSSAGSSTTASGSTSSPSSRRRSSRAWRGWAAGRSGSWRASRASSAGSSTTTRPVRASQRSSAPTRGRPPCGPGPGCPDGPCHDGTSAGSACTSTSTTATPGVVPQGAPVTSYVSPPAATCGPGATTTPPASATSAATSTTSFRPMRHQAHATTHPAPPRSTIARLAAAANPLPRICGRPCGR